MIPKRYGSRIKKILNITQVKRTVVCTGTTDTAAFNTLDHSDAENASVANENGE